MRFFSNCGKLPTFTRHPADKWADRGRIRPDTFERLALAGHSTQSRSFMAAEPIADGVEAAFQDGAGHALTDLDRMKSGQRRRHLARADGVVWWLGIRGARRPADGLGQDAPATVTPGPGRTVLFGGSEFAGRDAPQTAWGKMPQPR